MLGFGPSSSQAISAVDRSPISGAAVLSAAASIAVIGGATRRTSARLAGAASLAVGPAAIRVASARLTARASVSAAAIRVRPAAVVIRAAAQTQVRGGVIARSRAVLLSRAALAVEPSSAFEDLVRNPGRRLIYTIEMSPWLLVPYEDQA